MLQIILTPFTALLTLFYNLTGSYGVALILFAIVVKLILFPFSLKGKKSMIKMNLLNDRLQKLQKQYGQDRERYNMEVQRLYAEEKVSPMGGCLWSLLPLLILFPLYAIIRRPLYYLMGLTADQITRVAELVDWSHVAVDMGWIKETAAFSSSGYNELFLSSLINDGNLSSLQGISDRIFSINFNFLGINLSQVPEMKFWLIAGGFALFLLPVISAVTGLLSSFVSMRANNVDKNKKQPASGRVMMFISPLISLWIGFSMPAALCVYWICNNGLSAVQELIYGKILKKDYEKAAALKAERERQEKEAEKEEKRRKAEERARRLEEEKQNKGKKKPKPQDGGDNKPAVSKDASREGIRQYARGRAYDPNRFGGVTEYEDPGRKEEKPKEKPVEEKTDAPVEQPDAAMPEQSAVTEPAAALPETEPADAEAPYAEESEAEAQSETDKES